MLLPPRDETLSRTPRVINTHLIYHYTLIIRLFIFSLFIEVRISAFKDDVIRFLFLAILLGFHLLVHF